MRLCEKNIKPLGSRTIRMQRSNDRCRRPNPSGPQPSSRKNRLVYVILAERGLILSEAKAPQPDHDVHRARPKGCRIMIPPLMRCLAGTRCNRTFPVDRRRW